MTKRIVHVLHAWNGRTIAEVVRVLATTMADRGYAVTIVAATCTEGGGAEPGGVSVRSLEGTGSRTVTRVPALRAALEHLSPDVVYAHGNGPVRATVLATRARRRRPLLVGIEHNHYSSYPWRWRTVRDLVNRALLPGVDVLAGVSGGVIDDLAKSFPAVTDRLVVLPPPLTRYADLGLLAAEPVSHPWLGGTVPVITTVGHIHPRKDHRMLVRAMGRLREVAGPNAARAIIVGDVSGPEGAAVQAEIDRLELNDHVDLVGAQGNPLRFVARSDIFALSSRNEGMPVALLEAMGLGIPIVSTDCPSGPSWILDGGAHGLLVPVGDSDAFGDALARLLADPERREEFGRWGVGRAAAFSPDAVVDGYLAVADLSAPREGGRSSHSW